MHILMCFATLLFFAEKKEMFFCSEASIICPIGNKLKPFQQDERTFSGQWVMQHSKASAHNRD